VQYRIVIGDKTYAAVETLTSQLDVVTIIAEPSVVECCHCHATFSSKETVNADGNPLVQELVNGEYVCRVCLESSGLFRQCHECEAVGRAEDMHINDYHVRCKKCATWTCDCCEREFYGFPKEENRYGKPICEECAEYGRKQAANEKRYAGY